MSLEINDDKCMHCGACVGSCPENSLFLREFILEVDESYIECGTCVRACPIDALKLRGD